MTVASWGPDPLSFWMLSCYSGFASCLLGHRTRFESEKRSLTSVGYLCSKCTQARKGQQAETAESEKVFLEKILGSTMSSMEASSFKWLSWHPLASIWWGETAQCFIMPSKHQIGGCNQGANAHQKEQQTNSNRGCQNHFPVQNKPEKHQTIAGHIKHDKHVPHNMHQTKKIGIKSKKHWSQGYH